MPLHLVVNYAHQAQLPITEYVYLAVQGSTRPWVLSSATLALVEAPSTQLSAAVISVPRGNILPLVLVAILAQLEHSVRVQELVLASLVALELSRIAPIVVANCVSLVPSLPETLPA